MRASGQSRWTDNAHGHRERHRHGKDELDSVVTVGDRIEIVVLDMCGSNLIVIDPAEVEARADGWILRAVGPCCPVNGA